MSETLTRDRGHEDEQRQLAVVRSDLVREFADRLTPEQVAEQFDQAVSSFDGAPIRSFVPVLAQRSVRTQLRLTLEGQARRRESD